MVHSSICDTDRTVEEFARSGLAADVVVREPGRLGPVMTARAQMIRARGLLGPEDVEEIVVVRGRLAERLVGRP